MRCCDRYIRCERSLAAKPLNKLSRPAMQTVRSTSWRQCEIQPASQPAHCTGNEQVSVYPCTISDCSCCACAMTVSKLMYAWCHVMRIDLRCDHWLGDNYHVEPQSRKVRLWLISYKYPSGARSGSRDTVVCRVLIHFFSCCCCCSILHEFFLQTHYCWCLVVEGRSSENWKAYGGSSCLSFFFVLSVLCWVLAV